MKNRLFYFCLIGLFLSCSAGFSQQKNPDPSKNGINAVLDTRVDNMGYWMKQAEKGVTPYNPNIALTPAIFKGTQIRAKGIRTTNSPDVPVTNLTNVTESENSVFIDPNNADYLLNSNNSTSWSGGSVGTLYGACYFQSSNAGIGWVGSASGAGGPNSGDPTTAIGSNGREYINFIDDPGGQGVAYSDNGTSWSTATVAPPPADLADKNHMWIDNKATSPYEGNLYVAWTNFDTGGPDDVEIQMSRSTNDGLAWSTPVTISTAINAGSHNQGVNIQTGPGGEVYAAWAVYDGWPTDETAIGFAKSTNGGVSFSPATRILSNIKGIRTTETSKNHRVNSFPVMAVDISGGPNNGNIYIVWTNIGIPGTNTGTNISVYMIRSTNGGTTWSTPVRVNQGPNTAGKEAYFPWISCDPETGILSVVFYDDRNVTSTQCEVFSAYSTDAGATWIDFKVSDVAFTPAAIPGLAGGYMGDYLGITSKGGKVYPCWTDNRGGLYMTYVSPYELGLNASFGASSTTICTGSGVTFTEGCTGPPTSWTWSFPGGTPSSFIGQHPPVITYNTPGVYDVSLSVSDGVTTDVETKTGYITVKNVIADFTGTPTAVVIGNTVTFTDNSSCSPTSWTWSFPGGTPSTFSGQTPPAITYSTLGTYDVSLTVTKPGGTDTKTRVGYITVAPPIFNMTNGTVTTCTGDFYDSGGPTGNYLNNENLTETFYPSTAGSLIRFTFTSFNTESGYDYLRIYNGINTSAPLIGTYNGTTSPG
ncbi:MAG: PKD domain-containing protein, partial [Bacteroidetes bacterium]|nr:PKD domain-containing protein [Bacteroidota bacterium]